MILIECNSGVGKIYATAYKMFAGYLGILMNSIPYFRMNSVEIK